MTQLIDGRMYCIRPAGAERWILAVYHREQPFDGRGYGFAHFSHVADNGQVLDFPPNWRQAPGALPEWREVETFAAALGAVRDPNEPEYYPGDTWLTERAHSRADLIVWVFGTAFVCGGLGWLLG